MVTAEAVRRRLQRTMAALGAVFACWFLIDANWRGLAVLTLTVAAAIVQLRWLASQVSSLVALAASAPSATPQGEAGTDSAEGESLDFAGSRAEPSSSPGSPSDPHGADRVPDSPPEVARGGDRDPGDTVDVGATGVQVDGESQRPPSSFAIVFLRPLSLLLGLLLVFAFGSTEPFAIAAGVLTLPLALLVEVFLLQRMN